MIDIYFLVSCVQKSAITTTGGSILMADENNTDITALTVQLLSAFVSKNSVPSESLAELIKTTRAALTQDLAAPAPEVAPDHVPAVSVRKSIASPDHIISLIDGKPYKTLKRHLATNGLTPEQYRERYKLPKSYPLVAPNYSDARRAVAERLGLGRKTAAPATSTAPSPTRPAPAAKTVAAPTPANADAQKAAKKSAATKAEAAPAPKAEMSPKTKAQPRKRLSIASAKDEKPAAPKPAKAEAEHSRTPKAKPAKTAEPKAAVTKPKAASKPAAKSKAAKPAETAANAAPATTSPEAARAAS